MAFGLSGAAIGGIVAGAGAIGGALISSSASRDAAGQQSDAANRATDIQNAQWQQTQNNLRPYLNLGSSAINPLLQAMGYQVSGNGGNTLTRDQIYQNLLPQYTHTSQGGIPSGGIPGFAVYGGADNGISYNLDALNQYLTNGGGASQSTVDYNGLNSAVDDAMQRQQSNAYGNWTLDPNNILNQSFKAPTAEEAAQTPGYQFTLDNGLRAVQNSASARGLGTSGAAMRGAADYASGLANSTYNDVYSRALNTFNTNYGSAANRVNRLWNLVGSGQNAAATNGSLGAQTANSIGDTLMSGANAAAAGRVGSANALASGLNGLGQNALLYGMMQNNAGSGGGGGGGVGVNPFGYSGTYSGPNATYGGTA